MRFHNPAQLAPHRFSSKLQRPSRPGDPSVLTVQVTDATEQRIQFAFYYFHPTQRSERSTLLGAVRVALSEQSPEVFELPDYDYGPLICFEWHDHFILDLNSQFAKKLRGLDEFGYYVR